MADPTDDAGMPWMEESEGAPAAPRPEYAEYIQSEAWRDKRKARLALALNRCELCYRPEDLEVHHRTYARLGKEQASDLIALCTRCHEVFHQRLALYYDGNVPEGAEAPLANAPVDDALDALRGAIETGGLYGPSTGFEGLDDLTGGLGPGTFTILASRPSVGRTALALGIARNVGGTAEKRQRPLFVSTEESERALVLRQIAQASRVPRYLLHEASHVILGRAVDEVEGSVHLYSALGATVETVLAEARAFRRRYGLGLLVIDKLDDLRTKGAHFKPADEITAVAHALKEAAVDMGVPILATTTVSQYMERRGGDKRPQLQDIPDSLLNTADSVLFLYRAEHYGIIIDEQGNSTEGLAEVILAKSRTHPAMYSRLAFVRQGGLFTDLPRYEGESAQDPPPD